MKRLYLFFIFLIVFSVYAEESIRIDINYAGDTVRIASKQDLKTEFDSTTNHGNFKGASNKMEFLFGDRSFTWDKNGYYIEMSKWQNYCGEGSYIAFIPVESRIMTTYFVPLLPCEGGPKMGKCFDCIQNSIVKNKNILYARCIKKIPISEEFHRLIKKFFVEKRKSLADVAEKDLYFAPSGVACYYNLFMLYQSKNGTRSYFDMIPSECIDDKMRENLEIDEYIKLYDTLNALFSENFKECRWDNINNKKEIEEKCEKYGILR